MQCSQKLAASHEPRATNAGGCAIADLDSDGRLDFFLGSADGRHGIYQQTAPLQFRQLPETFGIDAELKAASACLWGDYGNDADVDLFLGGPDGLRRYRNDGPNFVAATQSCRLDPLSQCSTAAFADVDHDGDLDLLFGSAVGAASPGLRLQRNNLDGNFKDISQQALGAAGALSTRAVLCSDVDEYFLVDIIAYDEAGQPAVLRNQRDFTFAPAPDLKPAAIELPPAGESRALGDFDDDGAVDLLVNRSGQLLPAGISRAAPLPSSSCENEPRLPLSTDFWNPWPAV